MSYSKSKLANIFRNLFRSGLPKKVFSFRFSYYYKFRDTRNNILNQERLMMEFGNMHYSCLSEKIDPDNPGGKPVLLKKTEDVLYSLEEYDNLYSFLRKIKFDRIRDPQEHVSTYPGASSMYEEMELEVRRKEKSKKELFSSFSGDDMRVDGESEKIFEHTKGYMGNLIRKYFSDKK